MEVSLSVSVVVHYRTVSLSGLFVNNEQFLPRWRQEKVRKQVFSASIM